MYGNVIDKLSEPKNFDAFIQENMRNSTYKADWRAEGLRVEYEASKAFQTFTAEWTAAQIGVVVEKNAEKPLEQMPTAGEINGKLVRSAAAWQLDNDRLERYYYMERRLRDRRTTMTEEQYKAEYIRLVEFLFNPFERAAIAPHKRIDALYWEGLSNGTFTVNIGNNPKGSEFFAIPLGIEKHGVTEGAVWAKGNGDTMNVMGVLQYLKARAKAKGKRVVKYRVSDTTFNLMILDPIFSKNVRVTVGIYQFNNVGAITLDAVNSYLKAMTFAPIEIVDTQATTQTGEGTSLFQDNRVVAQLANDVAVLKVADPLEMIDPVPNKVYSTFDDNLVGMWRNDKGRFVDYDMWAIPVFTGRDDILIVDTSIVEA
jgi:hypothetical protein